MSYHEQEPLEPGRPSEPYDASSLSDRLHQAERLLDEATGYMHSYAGTIESIAKTSQDAHDRRMAESHLEYLAEWFRKVVELTGDHYHLTAEGWVPSWANVRESDGGFVMEVLDEVNAP